MAAKRRKRLKRGRRNSLGGRTKVDLSRRSGLSGLGGRSDGQPEFICVNLRSSAACRAVGLAKVDSFVVRVCSQLALHSPASAGRRRVHSRPLFRSKRLPSGAPAMPGACSTGSVRRLTRQTVRRAPRRRRDRGASDHQLGACAR
jgi:hypothetical protein